MSKKSRARKVQQRVKKRAEARRRVQADLGTDARWERGELAMDVSILGKRARAGAECRLDRLVRDGAISQAQHDAGLKVREYWWAAHKAPKVTAKGLYVSEAGIDEENALSPEGDDEEGNDFGKSLWQELSENLTIAERDAVIATCGLDAWSPLVQLRAGLGKMARHYHIAEKFSPMVAKAA